MQHFPRLVFTFMLLACTCVAPPAFGAGRYLLLDNPVRIPFSGFASSMAVVGDLDGDGANDLLVGAYDSQIKYDAPTGLSEHQGRAFVFSGKSGRLLLTLDAPERMPYAAFAFAVAGAGDVDKDGVPDLLIGSFGYGGSGADDKLGYGGTGRVFVFSGKDGKLLHTLQAPQPQIGGGFGWAVSSLSDLTGDGVPEILVGAFGQDSNGRVFIFDGYTDKLLRTLSPPEQLNGGAFGWSVADAGDLDKDGVADVLVGAPYSTVGKTPVQGRAYAFSGKDGKLLLTLDDPHPSAGAVFGWRLVSAGDLNKDGVPDILVGAPYKDVEGKPAQGEVFVFSGADAKLLFTLENPAPKPYAGFGYSLIQGADFDEDGASEIVIGAPFQTVDVDQVEGEVFVFNGQDGRHLITFDDPYPHQGATFGYSLASPGDLDGDKIPDFAFGAAGQTIMDKVAVGRVFIFRSQQ